MVYGRENTGLTHRAKTREHVSSFFQTEWLNSIHFHASYDEICTFLKQVICKHFNLSHDSTFNQHFRSSNILVFCTTVLTLPVSSNILNLLYKIQEKRKNKSANTSTIKRCMKIIRPSKNGKNIIPMDLNSSIVLNCRRRGVRIYEMPEIIYQTLHLKHKFNNGEKIRNLLIKCHFEQAEKIKF